MNNQPVDGAFQMPRPVIQVGALSEQKLLTGIRYGKNKGIAQVLENAFLHTLQLDFQDLPEFGSGKWFEDHDRIQTVYELRSESAAHSL